MGECDPAAAEFIALLAMTKLGEPALAWDLLYEIRYYHYAHCYIRRPTMRAALESLVERGQATRHKWRYQITIEGEAALRALSKSMPEGILKPAGMQKVHQFADDYDRRLKASSPASLIDEQTLALLISPLKRLQRLLEVDRLEAEGETWPYNVLMDARNGPSTGDRDVYVVKLEPSIRNRRKATNEGDGDMPCVYVGETGVTPEARFQQHKEGYKASRHVRDYGLHLWPELYEQYNPLQSVYQSQQVEAALAEKLRQLGYWVYGGH